MKSVRTFAVIVAAVCLAAGAASIAASDALKAVVGSYLEIQAQLASDKTDGVQAHIFGFLRFPAAGTYVFQVNSNDGVRREIGGKRIWEDGDVHPDRLSPPIPVQVTAPGLYPIKILYFEKRNTATLEVFWTAPGGQRTVIAGDAIVHLKR